MKRKFMLIHQFIMKFKQRLHADSLVASLINRIRMESISRRESSKSFVIFEHVHKSLKLNLYSELAPQTLQL